ncbi:putative Plant/MZA15-19 protein [Quillaja saponaria]|uniref:Plant/MZA15-19 protein n=1 Tax=Quillaja saponaria TaxID=32244 RepID=A0AAD7PF97_QUISA|nr:putative Plant/MZA15-19 protein [Quillaja saponaria]
MSLNCLTCQSIQRTDSERRGDYGKEYSLRKLFCVQMERSWSGNMSPPSYEQIRSGAVEVVKKKIRRGGHRRIHSTGTVAFERDTEPRLVRSCGMRRDWSFENLRGNDENNARLS